MWHKLKFLKPVIFDSIFLVAVFFVLVYARNLLYYYITQLQNYSLNIQSLQQSLVSGEAGAENILITLEPLKDIILRSQILLYLLVPLIIFILFVFLEGTSNRLVIGRKINWGYYGQFAVLTLPIYAIFIYLLSKFISALADWLTTGAINGSIFIAFIVYVILASFLYFTFAALITTYSVVEVLKKTFTMPLDKLVKILTITIGNLLIMFLIFVPIFIIYIRFMAGTISALSFILVLILIGLLVVCAMYRHFAINRIQKILK